MLGNKEMMRDGSKKVTFFSFLFFPSGLLFWLELTMVQNVDGLLDVNTRIE